MDKLNLVSPFVQASIFSSLNRSEYVLNRRKAKPSVFCQEKENYCMFLDIITSPMSVERFGAYLSENGLRTSNIIFLECLSNG